MPRPDCFLKIDGIPGESQDATHKGEIPVIWWSFSEKQKGSQSQGGGGGTAGVELKDIVIIKHVEKASPKLFLACAKGTHYPSALLTCRKAGDKQQEYLKITFKDVIISHYEPNPPHFEKEKDDIIPYEEFHLNVGEIKVEYREQNPDGSLAGSVVAEYNFRGLAAIP